MHSLRRSWVRSPSSSRASRLRSKRPLRARHRSCTFRSRCSGSIRCTAAAAAAETETAPADDLPAGTQVKSPLVGTFYSAPSPDEPPFVLVGQEVREGDTLCIIEAMKVMNEIKAPCSGKVVRIMVQPGDMVEYNQLLCIIE